MRSQLPNSIILRRPASSQLLGRCWSNTQYQVLTVFSLSPHLPSSTHPDPRHFISWQRGKMTIGDPISAKSLEKNIINSFLIFWKPRLKILLAIFKFIYKSSAVQGPLSPPHPPGYIKHNSKLDNALLSSWPYTGTGSSLPPWLERVGINNEILALKIYILKPSLSQSKNTIVL